MARSIHHYVQSDAADGFILVPHLTPTGLDPFADKVVPLLQEQGAFRTDYEGTTLRDHLGLDPLPPPLPQPVAPPTAVALGGAR